MKTTIIMSNEERKKIQIENDLKDPEDLKAYFACFLECDPEDIKIELEEKQTTSKRTLETTLTANDIRKLKKDQIFTKEVFITTLILKYKKRVYRKKNK